MVQARKKYLTSKPIFYRISIENNYKYMNSTIMIQKSVKDLALQRAKKEGFSLSMVAKILLKDYADGRLKIGSFATNSDINIEKMERISVDPETQKLMDKSLQKYLSQSPEPSKIGIS